MEISINVKAVHDALGHAASVVPTRTPKPVLQNVLLSYDDRAGLAKVVATDLEVGLTLTLLGVDSPGPFRVLIHPSRFKSILDAAARYNETLTLILADEADADGLKGLAVRGSRIKYDLVTESPDLYPVVAGFEGADYHEVAPDDFAKLVRRTVMATDATSTRYALGGCLAETDEARGVVSLVGCDGNRLARQEVAANKVGAGGFPAKARPILPVKAMRLVERVLKGDEMPASVAFRENDFSVRTDRAVVYGRLVEGRFPHYETAMGGPGTTSVAFKAGDFLDACQAAAVMTSEESRGVDFRFARDVTGPSLSVSSRAADKGAGAYEMPLDSMTGPDDEVTMDVRYLNEFLPTVDRDSEVTAKLSGATQPVSFSTGDGYLYVAMPLTKAEPGPAPQGSPREAATVES